MGRKKKKKTPQWPKKTDQRSGSNVKKKIVQATREATKNPKNMKNPTQRQKKAMGNPLGPQEKPLPSFKKKKTAKPAAKYQKRTEKPPQKKNGPHKTLKKTKPPELRARGLPPGSQSLNLAWARKKDRGKLFGQVVPGKTNKAVVFARKNFGYQRRKRERGD